MFSHPMYKIPTHAEWQDSVVISGYPLLRPFALQGHRGTRWLYWLAVQFWADHEGLGINSEKKVRSSRRR